MRSASHFAFVLLTALAFVPARAGADEGALTLDVSAGGSLLRVPAPYVEKLSTNLGFTPSFQLGLRYAFRNWLDVGLSGFYEPPGTYYNHGVTVETADGSFPGVLSYQLQRFGALAGVRVLTGTVFHLVLGLDAGWSHRMFSSFTEFDDSDPSSVTNYGLTLPNLSEDNLLIAPVAGVEWALGDHWGFSFLPRFEFLLGKDPTWVANATLSFNWSWYL